MIRVRLLFVLPAIVVTLGCSVFTGPHYGWGPDNPAPDIFIHVIDKTTGHRVYQPCIVLYSLDSAGAEKFSWNGGLWDVAGDTLELSILHDEYPRIDTTIVVPFDTLITVEIYVVSNLIASGLPDKSDGPYKEGWDSASQLLEEDNACIYLPGGLRATMLNIDEETGLPLRGNFTCIVSDELFEYSEGHNDRITLYVDRHGVPKNSKKRWMEIILDPECYYDSVAKALESVPLNKNGTKVLSPTAEFSVGLQNAANGDDYRARVLTTSLVTDESHFRQIWDVNKRPAVELVWGPPESEIMILKTREDYLVFDIRYCEMLNLVFD